MRTNEEVLDGLMPYTCEELREAGADYIAARAGIHRSLSHPVAAKLADRGVTLKQLAEQFGVTALGKSGRDVRHPPLAAGLGSDDFGRMLADAVHIVMYRAYDAARDFETICRPLPVRKLATPTEFPSMDIGQTLEPMPESREWPMGRVITTNGTSAALRTWARRFLISREVIVNDDAELIASIFGSTGAAVAATEAATLCELIESNPTLGDDAPMFAAGAGGNLFTSTALNATNLSIAMGAMRSQVTPAGNLANHAARALVVAAGLEATALELVRNISTGTRPAMQVIGLPWLTAGHWYLFADPTIAPAVGRMFLEGTTDRRSISVAQGRTSTREDGAAITAHADFEFVALGRVGAIRCEA